MSKMDDFLKKASEDETIKAELLEILDLKNEKEMTEDDARKVMEIAKKHGFELNEIGELSDDDLKQTVGGCAGIKSYYEQVQAEFKAQYKAQYEEYLKTRRYTNE